MYRLMLIPNTDMKCNISDIFVRSFRCHSVSTPLNICVKRVEKAYNLAGNKSKSEIRAISTSDVLQQYL